MSIHGVHGPNATWSEEAHLRTTGARAQAVKLMWYHTPDDVAELRRRGVTAFLVRLPDSVAPGGRWKGLSEWTVECSWVVQKFLAAGVVDFQLDCESNETWGKPTPDALTNWRWLTGNVVDHLHLLYPQARFGLTPFSWNPATWKAVEELWIPKAREIVDKFQFICVNSYWQAPGHYNDPSFGGNVTHWHDRLFPGEHRFVVTEWGCSADLPPAELEARRVTEYPAWKQWIDTKPYVDKDFLYIIYGTEDWAHFWPTDRVLRVL